MNSETQERMYQAYIAFLEDFIYDEMTKTVAQRQLDFTKTQEFINCFMGDDDEAFYAQKEFSSLLKTWIDTGSFPREVRERMKRLKDGGNHEPDQRG